MHVFITGGSGLVGSAVVTELLGNGHTVLALARSDASAHALEQAGAQTIRGDLAAIALLVKPPQRVDQVAADGAAQAAGREQDGVFAGCLDQFMIEADLAEFVDDDGGFAHVGMGEEIFQQRSLAAA